MNRFAFSPRRTALAAGLLAAAAVSTSALANEQEAAAAGWDDPVVFNMVRSPGLKDAPNCARWAKGRVSIQKMGGVEEMTVKVQGLPPNTDFAFFVLQVPNFPFGMGWYQGEIRTDWQGKGQQKFVGRFNQETFSLAIGNPAPAPSVHPHSPFPDATTNPLTPPLHQFHLGMWFNKAADAQKAGCPGNVTPFSGEHDAGIQVLNTSNFPDHAGPLRRVK
ncbi:hypothetical protein [Azohydromonas caseinilytica]|uniref:Uncharacterized protein n=1 Tax=Azohydromonas caseinilytica TaxID=2728836 RepID=A0A848F972_9BURK|nr:hypothetical protein [Azohydromonas caseinilytica]NML15798.1 hypothetical protein [Azohydromonas caseinilytica]